LKESFPEAINGQNILQSYLNGNFVALKVGDVNNTANPSTTSNRNDNEPMVIKSTVQAFNKGDVFEIPFLLERNNSTLEGMQFTLRFDPEVLKFKQIKGGALLDLNFSNLGLTQLEQGLIHLSWDGTSSTEEQLMAFEFEALQKGNTRENVYLAQQQLSAELYSNNQKYPIQLHMIDAKQPKEQPVLYQNRPNPFSEVTEVGFLLPETMKIQLTITDITGRICKQVTGTYEKGFNSIAISKQDLPNGGVFTYSIVTESGTMISKKMVLFKD
jgi:hypothetical protein